MLGHVVFRWFARSAAFRTLGTLRSDATPTALQGCLGASATLVRGIDVLDIPRLELLIRDFKPLAVINCIGLVKQLGAAQDPLQAVPINALLPHQLARICAITGSRLVHIGTDCVFSGLAGSYREGDLPDPVDLYGRTKLVGEPDASHVVTLRSSLVGPELGTRHGLLSWFLNAPGPVKGYARAVFSGLPTVEVAQVIEQHILPNPSLSGIYHLASEPIDKHAFLGLVAREYGIPTRIESDETVVIDRSLDASRFRAATGYTPPAWPELVRRMRAFG
jgi:dTDP-4-dehydrorhamnose reductase